MSNSFNGFLFNFHVADLSFGHKKGIWQNYSFSPNFLFVCSLAVLDPRVGHTMDILSPFIPVLCHSDWLFHGESCPRLDVVHPGRAWPSSPACTRHCSLRYLFLQATPLFSSWCDHSMLASLLWRCLTVPSLLHTVHESRTTHASLKSTRRQTGSQCNLCRTAGAMCWHRLVPLTRWRCTYAYGDVRRRSVQIYCIFCSIAETRHTTGTCGIVELARN